MSEKQGSVSHFAGVIRIVVAAVLVLLLVFFFTRWAVNRREANNNAERAAQSSSKTDEGADSTSASSADAAGSKVEIGYDSDASDAGDAAAGSSSSDDIPSGIADTGPSQTIPNTGSDASAVLMAATIATALYVGVYAHERSKRTVSM